MTNNSMRADGRAPDALRPVNLSTGYLLTAEGSVLIDCGNTRVLCAATVEDGVPSFLRNSGKGWVTAEYSMLPRSTTTRNMREAARGKQSGRTLEIQRLIGRSLRTAVQLDALGERSIIVDCDVLQADGGTRTASITGAWVAMALAIQKLVQFGTLKRSPMIDSVAAVSVGIVAGRPLLDLNYAEDSAADVDMNVVMTGSGKFVEVQATGEKAAFDDTEMSIMLDLARTGILQLQALQKSALGV